MRYLRLLGIQLRASVLLAMQYRLDFVATTLMVPLWTAAALAPLLVLFRLRTEVAGWSREEALLVVGFFTLLKGFLAGAMQPSLLNAVEHVRKGTLDFLLLKPVDAQFMISTSKFDFARLADVVAGMAIIVYALVALGTLPHPAEAAAAAALLVAGGAILYSFWILAVSLAFHVVKVDNLAYLIVSTYDAARWPSSVFRGVFAFAFTFIVPLALMTTYPALALLGTLTWSQAAVSVVAATSFLVLSRAAWQRSISRYTSAGG